MHMAAELDPRPPDVPPPPARPVDDRALFLDASGRIIDELRCVRCGYNLKLQPAGGRCPECGEPCLTTLNLSQLRRSPAAWLDRVAGAVQLVWLGLLGMTVSMFLGFLPVLSLALSLVATIVLMVALARFNPMGQGIPSGVGGVTLWLLRYGGWGLLLPIGALLIAFPLLGAGSHADSLLTIILAIVLAVALLVMIVKFAAVPWAVFRWLGRLMDLAPNARLARICRVTSWLWFWGFLVGGFAMVGFFIALAAAFSLINAPANPTVETAATAGLVVSGGALLLSGLSSAAAVLMALIFLPGVRRVLLLARDDAGAAQATARALPSGHPLT